MENLENVLSYDGMYSPKLSCIELILFSKIISFTFSEIVENVDSSDLLQFYTTYVHPVTEYCCEAFHDFLRNNLLDELEKLQKCARRIIFPFISYADVIMAPNFTTTKY